MKILNRSYLPKAIIYNGNIYTCNYAASSDIELRNKTDYYIKNEAEKITGSKKILLVNVLSRKLKGKTDLYGNLYKPSKWIFTPKEIDGFLE